jgi:outer membrane biogenesis lipoprotein LolB
MASQSFSRRSGARVPLVALALLAACSGGAGAKQEVETLDSWRATIDLASEAQFRGWVTPRYAHQLRDKARIALNQAAKSATSAKMSAAARDSVTLASQALEKSVRSLERVGP